MTTTTRETATGRGGDAAAHWVLVAFGLLAAANLLGGAMGWPGWVWASKPLLLPALALYFWRCSAGTPYPAFRRWLTAGLLLSAAGDIFLLFVEQAEGRPHFFLLGLGSFLLAHLCYLWAFLGWQRRQQGQGSLTRRPWWGIPFAVLFVATVAFLWPSLPVGLSVPVVCYAAAIVGMAAGAFHATAHLDRRTAYWLMASAALFILSDLFIGIRQFKADTLTLPQPHLLVMATYLAGQYGIARAGVVMAKWPSTRNA